MRAHKKLENYQGLKEKIEKYSVTSDFVHVKMQKAEENKEFIIFFCLKFFCLSFLDKEKEHFSCFVVL